MSDKATEAVAIGANAGVNSGNQSIAIGVYSWAKANSSIAIGSSEPNGGPPTVASDIGQQSTTGNYLSSGDTGNFGTSVGFNTHTAFAATAVGTDAQAKGDSSSAFGRFSNASAASSLALGIGATASKTGSVAIGSGSLANVANTVSVGTNTGRRRIVNVASALADSEAATLGQVKPIATAAAQTASANVQREVADLRAIVKEQQAMLHLQREELAAMKSRMVTTASQE